MAANGYAMLRDDLGHIINLKIEPDGQAVGVLGGSYCTVTLFWQKQGQH